MRRMMLAATGLVISAVVVLGFWWLEPKAGKTAGRIVDASSAQQAMPSRPAPRQPNADAEPKATNETGPVATSLDDVYGACGGMLQGGLPPDHRALRDGGMLAGAGCLQALDSLFSEESASSALLPVVPPMRWNDLFDDVAGDISAVIAAAGDPECAVPQGEIRPHLGAGCAARPMAELAALVHACGSIFPSAFEGPSDSRPWSDVTLRTPGTLPFSPASRLRKLYSNYDPDGEARQRMIDQYASSASDQETYWRLRHDEDRLSFRTAWLASKCAPHVNWLGWMGARPNVFDDMMARAARLGDPFALAHDVGTTERARQLLAINPAQAYLHLAVLESNRAHEEWEGQARELVNEAERPYFDVRRRFLALAGVECPSPCSEDDLRALETSHERALALWRTGCFIAADRCPDIVEMEALEEALKPARRAAGLAQQGVLAEHRRRVEAVRLKYVIAAETIAAASGVSLRGRYANPAGPGHLDGHDTHLARVAAQAMIAEHRARFGGPLP